MINPDFRGFVIFPLYQKISPFGVFCRIPSRNAYDRFINYRKATLYYTLHFKPYGPLVLTTPDLGREPCCYSPTRGSVSDKPYGFNMRQIH